MESKLMWIVNPNGEITAYDYMGKANHTHMECCEDFCEKHKIEAEYCYSHNAYGELLASLGYIIVFNSGHKLDNYYFCVILLPEEMTIDQINVLEDLKETFNTKYHQDAALFKAQVYTTVEQSYKITNHFRDLEIERKIANLPPTSGPELLYQELEIQKEKLLSR